MKGGIDAADCPPCMTFHKVCIDQFINRVVVMDIADNDKKMSQSIQVERS